MTVIPQTGIAHASYRHFEQEDEPELGRFSKFSKLADRVLNAIVAKR